MPGEWEGPKAPTIGRNRSSCSAILHLDTFANLAHFFSMSTKKFANSEHTWATLLWRHKIRYVRVEPEATSSTPVQAAFGFQLDAGAADLPGSAVDADPHR